MNVRRAIVGLLVGCLLIVATLNPVEALAQSAEAPTTAAMSVDAKMTPGHTSKVKVKKLCDSRYLSKSKSPKKKTVNKVFKAYKIAKAQRGDYEMDHLVPVEVGGDNDKKNLWPQAKSDVFAIADKNNAEVQARVAVCEDHEDLKSTQAFFKSDWKSAKSKLDALKPAVTPATPAITPVPTTTEAPTTIVPPTTAAPVTSPPTTATPTTKAPAPATTAAPKHYTNSDGNVIESPSANTNGATAQCNDGSYSHSQHRQGTCSGHGGVGTWL